MRVNIYLYQGRIFCFFFWVTKSKIYNYQPFYGRWETNKKKSNSQFYCYHFLGLVTTSYNTSSHGAYYKGYLPQFIFMGWHLFWECVFFFIYNFFYCLSNKMVRNFGCEYVKNSLIG